LLKPPPNGANNKAPARSLTGATLGEELEDFLPGGTTAIIVFRIKKTAKRPLLKKIF